MADKISEGLKKAMYTGVGLAAVSVDAAGKAIDVLAKKGEQAVAKGRVFNEELKRKTADAGAAVKNMTDALEQMGRDEIEAIRAKMAEMESNAQKAKDAVVVDADAIICGLETLSKEELDSVKEKIEQIRTKWTEDKNDDDNDKGAEG